ncbi:MAG: DUF2723 domain-containing protein, partial [Caldilineaceae bacterium]
MIIGISSAAVKSQRHNYVDWLIAATIAASSFLLYFGTAAPDILPGDSGEFQLAAWRLGLSHATGYPLYMLLGSLWQHLLAPFGVSPAAALNVLSAVFAALAVSATYLLLLDAPVASPITRRLVAIFAACLLAVNQAFWSQAVVAEVYSLHTLLMLTLLLALQHAALPEPGSSKNATISPRGLVWAAAIFGLSLTHHAMSVLYVPAILIYLWSVDLRWWRMPWRVWLAIVAALLLPLVLYVYVPLRGGPGATPWFHQPLGESTLNLYTGGFSSFVEFVTGRSISVGFYSLQEALGNVAPALELWRQQFGILGLLLVGLGIYVLAMERRSFLWLTAGIAVAQQVFNLFYAIGDIGVYYIPLYAVGVLWAGYGAAGLCDGMLLRMGQGDGNYSLGQGWGNAGAVIALVLFLLPVSAYVDNLDSVDQSQNHASRADWESIVEALPEGRSILVSNDRDDIPPFFYLQYVEGAAPDVTALHPLMAPDSRFSDLGATLDTALDEGGGAPVYLVKPMPGLEVKYDLLTDGAPLVRVEARQPSEPAYVIDHALGELTLLGFDWLPTHTPSSSSVMVRLYWLVDGTLDADYTTSVQLFGHDGDKLAQSDSPPGGVYYPSSLWKPGERIMEEHVLSVDPTVSGDLVMQVGMYAGPDLNQLGQPLRLQTPPLP